MFLSPMSRMLHGLWVLLLVASCLPPPAGPGPGTPPLGREIPVPRSLPPEMTPLAGQTVLTRAGLAVLLLMELPVDRLERPHTSPVVVDAEGHWAREEILSAVRLGLMPIFANHRFLPDRPVTRGETARILAGILEKLGVPRGPSLGRGLPADLPPSHLLFPAIRAVLEAGVMEMDASGRFDVSGPVSGTEALKYIRKIKGLLPDGVGGG